MSLGIIFFIYGVFNLLTLPLLTKNTSHFTTIPIYFFHFIQFGLVLWSLMQALLTDPGSIDHADNIAH